MPIPLIPVAIFGLAGTAFVVNKARVAKTEVTPQVAAERAIVFDTAINSCQDTAKLKELADVFEKVGCKPEATALRLRAALRDAPPELKQQRREALNKGLASTNKAGILNLANAFESIGATVAAAKLREHASTLA
jgi:hypothetical protein